MFKFQEKPFFDPQGNWYIPKTTPFGGQLTPELKPTEWLVFLLDNSINVPKDAYKHLIGASSTVWRIRKRLKDQCYEAK